MHDGMKKKILLESIADGLHLLKTRRMILRKIRNEKRKKSSWGLVLQPIRVISVMRYLVCILSSEYSVLITLPWKGVVAAARVCE